IHERIAARMNFVLVRSEPINNLLIEVAHEKNMEPRSLSRTVQRFKKEQATLLLFYVSEESKNSSAPLNRLAFPAFGRVFLRWQGLPVFQVNSVGNPDRANIWIKGVDF